MTSTMRKWPKRRRLSRPVVRMSVGMRTLRLVKLERSESSVELLLSLELERLEGDGFMVELGHWVLLHLSEVAALL